MATDTHDEISLALGLAGVESEVNVVAMHLTEVELEADRVLDLLATLRSMARQGDATRTEETLAELVIALEHLAHHAQAALPTLQRELELDSAAE
jgi:hypothetical protein